MADVLLVNDIHLSDRPPSSCTDSYLDDLFTLLGQTVQIAERRGSVGVVWAGDVFHHKTPGRTSHATVMRAIDVATAYPCPLYVVPGNHDMTHDRLDSITDTQPLGVLLRSEAAELLHGWDRTHLLPIFGLPWLQHWNDDTVSHALAGFRAGQDLHDGPGLVVTHAPLYPPGRELPYENYPTDAFAAAMGVPGAVHYGHVHEPHGIYQVGDVRYSNPGALSRGSLHEHNLTRQVQIGSYDIDTGELTHVALSAKPAADVFRLQEITAVRTAQLALDDFLSSIGQTRIEITSIESVRHHIASLELESALTDVILRVLSEVGRG